MEPAGRHALITGGGRGIGAAVARALSAAGAAVTVLGRSAAPLTALVAPLAAAGAAAGWVAADVTDAAALTDAVAAAVAARGPIDILVNNAGAAESAPLSRTDRALWERMLALNLTAVYEATRLLLPGMAARGWGRVVTVASTAGLTGYPYVSAYVAAKHGAVGLMRALAREMARSGVTLNAVCPGYTETDMLAASIATIAARTGRTADQARAALAATNPQGRLVRPEEVAATVLFLCGADAAAITGQAIAVAGGEVM